MQGRIFNIQRFSVHDGPGIRDTVFLKGCPLRCVWCSNPESQAREQELAWNCTRCIGCGNCVRTCRSKGTGALSFDAQKGVSIDRHVCSRCYECVKTCHAEALHIYGEDVTAEDVMSQTIKRNVLWRGNGGITVSGGEVLMQSEFAAELLAKHHAAGIHTAIETSLYGAWSSVEKIVQHCDLVFCDIKIFDTGLHKKYTGVSNECIKENFQKMQQMFPNLEIIVRTPVIPGINDTEDNFLAIAEFLKNSSIRDYELLGFHNFGEQKYAQLGRSYDMAGVSNVKKSDILPYNNLLRNKLGLAPVFE
jgi:pyruvate formate lyase activating enzyme